MKLLTCLALLLPTALFAQAPIADYNTEREALTRRGLNVLGGWALANVAGGTVGALTAEGEAKYFSQMSLGWGAVNLALVAASRLSKSSSAPTDRPGTVRAQLATENLFLLNNGLDVAYVATGFYLLEQAKTQDTPEATARSRGYGQALLVQGGFLFLFDGLMYAAHHRHGNRQLYPLLSRLSVGPGSLAVRW